MPVPRFLPFFRLFILAAGFILAFSTYAAKVEVEGAALIDAGGLDKARQLAVEDGLRKAEDLAGVDVSATSIRTPEGEVRENSRFRAMGTASNPTIIREWREGDTLYVRLNAEITPADPHPHKSPSYRKKIAVTQFHVAQPLQVQDLDNIWDGYPLALLRRLDESGLFLPIHTAASSALGKLALPLDRAQNRETVRLLAEQSGAQIVLSGFIHDAGATMPSGILPKFLPSAIVPKSLANDPGSRRIEVEIFLHDGITGALIAHFRAHETATGNPVVGRDKPFGSAAFFSTPFGSAVAQLLDRQSRFITDELGNLPFNAKIIRVEGNLLFFDAGGTSGVAAGDKFMLYTLSPLTETMEPGSNRLLGITEKPAAGLTVRQVQPLFSLGESDGKNLKIQIGDMIRFERATISREK